MIARGAEANPSCFSPSGLEDPIDVILPLYTRVAMVTNNIFSNSKYCMAAMDLAKSSKEPVPGIKQIRHKLKADMTHVKEYKGLCELLKVDYEAASRVKRIEDVLPGLREKMTVQGKEIRDETEEELKRKIPAAKRLEQETAEKKEESPASSEGSSAKENEAPAAPAA
jgi:tRNA-dihydrouridine synthase 2